MSQMCQRCNRVVHRACQSATEAADCLDEQRARRMVNAALRDEDDRGTVTQQLMATRRETE